MAVPQKEVLIILIRIICTGVIFTFVLNVLVSSLAAAVEISPGDILVADSLAPGNSTSNDGSVIKVNPFNGDQLIVSSGGLFGSPIAIAYDQNRDVIFVAAFGSPRATEPSVFKIEPSTGTKRSSRKAASSTVA